MSDVFGIFATAQQPAREVESIVDMGQHKLFEAQPISLLQIVQRLSPISGASCVDRMKRDFILEGCSVATSMEGKT